jgi:hypothetical protein
MCLLDFETRKDAAQVFGALVRIKEDAAERSPGAIYVEQHPDILRRLFDGWVGMRLQLGVRRSSGNEVVA